jgi:hypothetical protein
MSPTRTGAARSSFDPSQRNVVIGLTHIGLTLALDQHPASAPIRVVMDNNTTADDRAADVEPGRQLTLGRHARADRVAALLQLGDQRAARAAGTTVVETDRNGMS